MSDELESNGNQDWKVIKVRFNSKQKKELGLEKPKKVVKVEGNNKNNLSNKKLENSEDLKHIYVPKAVGKELQQIRQAKGLTIKQAAIKLNMKSQDLQQIEQCKALYNKAIINKIKRKL